MRKLILPLAVLAFLCACAHNSATSARAAPGPGVTAAGNGRTIFLTGKDAAGFQILAQRPPLHTSCAACHLPNGSGGVHLPGGAVSADLRHEALVTDQKPPYSVATLERAISTGIDNQGKPLDPVMPRWNMSPRDLHDVAAYVMTLK